MKNDMKLTMTGENLKPRICVNSDLHVADKAGITVRKMTRMAL